MHLAALFMQLAVVVGLVCADLALVILHLRLNLREKSSRAGGKTDLDVADRSAKSG